LSQPNASVKTCFMRAEVIAEIVLSIKERRAD